MTQHDHGNLHPSDPSVSGRGSIHWPLVIGLGSLALLWPLTSALGLHELLGGGARAALLLAVIAAVWIGVVGLGRVARPVMTLTLAGVVAGALVALTALVLGDASGVRAVLVTIWSVTWQVLMGVVTGVIAHGIQQVRS